MLSAVAAALLAGSAAAYPRTPLLFSRQAYSAPGVATFNDYASQSGTVCGPMSGSGGTYGAAASDISPDISGGACASTIDMSKCSGTSAVAGYEGPSCPKTNCGTCYKVTNQGGMDGGSVGGIGNSIIVQIIDSCPSESAQNYCKTDVQANQRCGDASTNQLDIDQSAYQALTGTPFGSGPNLQISIAPSDCSGGSSTGGGSSSGGAEKSTVSTEGGSPGGSQAGGAAITTTTPQPVAQTPNPSTNNNNNNKNNQQSSGGGGGGGSGTAAIYAQCGGIDNSNNQPWSGPTTCAAPNTCQAQNQYYSQCLPPSSRMGKKRDGLAFKDEKSFFVSEDPAGKKRDAIATKDETPFLLSKDNLLVRREVGVILEGGKAVF